MKIYHYNGDAAGQGCVALTVLLIIIAVVGVLLEALGSIMGIALKVIIWLAVPALLCGIGYLLWLRSRNKERIKVFIDLINEFGTDLQKERLAAGMIDVWTEGGAIFFTKPTPPCCELDMCLKKHRRHGSHWKRAKLLTRILQI